ncbi:MAG: prepilin-type N-terminal cleavage/methylation domain-containing protein [Phycisphaerales bacterium JB040]
MRGRAAHAFTLVEVLVSLALLAVLSGVLLGFGAGVAERRTRVQRVSVQDTGIDEVFHRIDRALTAADANASGVRVSPGELSVTHRVVTTADRTEEFDTLTLSYNASAGSLTLSTGRDASSRVIEGVEHAEFRAETGSGWGPFSGGGLPRAVQASVWLTTAEPAPDEAPIEEFQADPLSERPLTTPDRWRVFSLVDVLGEVGR